MHPIVSRYTAAALILGSSLALAVPAQRADAQNLLEFLFGGIKQQQRPPAPAPANQNPIDNFFNDAFGNREQQQPSQRASSGVRGGSAGFCVRTCDGKYFPLLRSATSPEQMCQAFCPASATKVYFGSVIDDASSGGERYGDSNTAFAFRKALKADCTCNGKSPAGLAQVDLGLDNSLRAGDVVATGNGLVAYTGSRGGPQDFTPVASYPGLTSEVRSRLGEMKVSPNVGDQTSVAPTNAAAAPATTVVQRSNAPKTGRALINAEATPAR